MAVNLYQSIYRELLRQILDGRLPVGQEIPTEAALMQLFDASRVTVRKALDALKREGVLSSTAGRGTVVMERAGGFGCDLDMVVMVAPVTDPFYYASMVEKMDDLVAEQSAVLLSKYDTKGHLLEDSDLYLNLLDRGVRHVVLWPHVHQQDWSLLNRMRAVGMNMVVLDQPHPTAAADVVALDAVQGMDAFVKAIEAEVGVGHSYLMLGHDTALPSAHARQDAFEQRLGGLGSVQELPRYADDAERDAAVLATLRQQLKDDSKLRGIVCSHGGLGLATARAVEQLGRTDVVVASYDYLPSMEGHTLWALRQPFEAMAQAAMESLRAQSTEPDQWRARMQLFPGELVGLGRRIGKRKR
ncbi:MULTISPECIES: GntR family transcriptional regulator [unclassified Lentimonas]|uniref:GntR family transcriptional regulator n=1 Tax=unclassified Lentimonas TaxID=2630993 RepID=UPI001322DD34|nr:MULTISPECIES: GntR family transcriptional regulator [unclassified Lentimonas]CAA6689449.1 Unannotated [Lentimonas sp. CC10]CAA6696426.1 Unannotated [Lentimonas sp. CC19]CAA7070513.1 Unannotated [Lentimonas sp. CC11]